MMWARLALAATIVALGLMVGVQPVAAETPENLSKAIAQTQLDALTQVVALMKDRPAPDALQPKLELLKEETIKKMVDLGKKCEALNPDERKAVGALVEKAHNRLPPELITDFTQGNAYYKKLDDNLSKLIMDFFLIPQYALFSVLKKYAPEEAKRLGIQ